MAFFVKTLKSSLFNLESLETIRICIFRLIGPAKDVIFTKTIHPRPLLGTAMIAIPSEPYWLRGKNLIFGPNWA